MPEKQVEYLRRTRGGDQPAVIFAHGSFMDESMFAPQLEALSGVGWQGISCRSRALTCPEDLHTLADLVDDVMAIADMHGLRRFVLCGMSVGAFMAIELAMAYPERLHGLVMIDGKAASYTSEEREALAPVFEPLDRAGGLPVEFARWLAPLCFGETTCARNPGLVDEWMFRWTKLLSSRSAHRQYRSWIDKPDRSDALASIDLPVLLFHGAEDKATPSDHSVEMDRRLPDSRLVIVPEAGHTSNLEQPDFVNRELVHFLKQFKT